MKKGITQDLICFRIFSQLSNVDLTSSLLRVLSVYAEVLPSLRFLRPRLELAA